MSTSRTCSICTNDLPRAEFSKNQWQKGLTAKCKRCVAGNPPPKQEPENPVPELREPTEDVVKKEEEEQAAAAAAEKGKIAAILNFYLVCKQYHTCVLIFILPSLND